MTGPAEDGPPDPHWRCERGVMAAALQVEWLGSVPYAEALEIQHKAVEARQQGAAPDRLLNWDA